MKTRVDTVSMNPPKPPVGTLRRHRRAGLGLLEALAALVVIAFLLAGLVIASDSLRSGSAQQQTRDTLRQLRAALNRYTALHGKPPHGPAPAALFVLFNDPAVKLLLQGLTLSHDSSGRITLLDGYGNAIDYLGPEQNPPQGVDFVSAGADGKFGRASLDDLYGADTEGPTP